MSHARSFDLLATATIRPKLRLSVGLGANWVTWSLAFPPWTWWFLFQCKTKGSTEDAKSPNFWKQHCGTFLFGEHHWFFWSIERVHYPPFLALVLRQSPPCNVIEKCWNAWRKLDQCSIILFEMRQLWITFTECAHYMLFALKTSLAGCLCTKMSELGNSKQ